MYRVRLVVAVIIALTLGIALVALQRLHPDPDRFRSRLQERFLYGVPWGTLVVVGFVLAVYLLVQDGRTAFDDPVTIPYRAWSYWYPLGMLTASFTHASSGHLLGNLAGTVVLAPIAEYVWGHYPRDDGRTTAGGLRADPRVRALVIFPAVVISIGLLTSLFALGPVIGFSGVVFAFAGFAIVRYPITTVLAAVGAQGVVLTVYRAVESPIIQTTAQTSPPAPPSWATIAIQGHAFGFFVGLLLGIAVLHRRGYRPDPVHLWVALVIFGFGKSLWAVYWFGSGGRFILFRAPGTVLVLALTVLVTAAVTASDRPLFGRQLRESPQSSGRHTRIVELGFTDWRSDSDGASGRLRRLAAAGIPGTGSGSARTPSQPDRLGRRQAALVAVLLVLALIAGPAIPTNLFVVDPDGTDSTHTVEDYRVAYEENVTNPLVAVGPLERLGLDDSVTTSGVIVWSEDRHLWTDPVTADRLAFSGEETIDLGGPGWREEVTAERVGWNVVGNDTVYQVWLNHDGDERLAFTAGPARSNVVIDNHTFTLETGADGFEFEVEGDSNTETVSVPEENESVTVGALTIEREDDDLIASGNGTRAVIASAETYN